MRSLDSHASGIGSPLSRNNNKHSIVMKHSHLVILGLAIGLALYSCKSRQGISADQSLEPCQYVAVEDYHPAVPAEYVDLGLPSGTLWAPFNIGATKPSEVGDKFAWGEVTPKSRYDWGTYKLARQVVQPTWLHFNGKSYTTTKYKYSYWADDDAVDHKWLIEAEDDAASSAWGPNWCIPANWDWAELAYYCKVTADTLDGTCGVKYTGPNGNSIFVPFTEVVEHQSAYADTIFGRTYGTYWSSSLVCPNQIEPTDRSANAIHVGANTKGFATPSLRYIGHCVRPIASKPDFLTNVTLSQDNESVSISSEAFQSGTVVIDGVEDKLYSGKFIKDLPLGVHDVFFTSEVCGRTYSTDTISFYVTQSADTAQAIDLGLSVKWAPFNIGATKSTECGDYFAYGDRVPAEINKGLENKTIGEVLYDELQTSDNRFLYRGDYYYYVTPICGDEDESEDESDKIPEEELKSDLAIQRYNSPYDPASLSWGKGWRMPTQDEWNELVEKCSWKWGTRNGVPGYFVQSLDDKYTGVLFFPAFYQQRANPQGNSLSGAYWSSNRSYYKTYSGKCIFFTRSGVYTEYSFLMSKGLMVRPVLPK